MALVNGTNGRDFIHVAGDGHAAPDGYKDKPKATDLSDIIDVSQGGNDIVFAGDGMDTIKLGGAFTANDQIDGGANTDTAEVSGDFSAGLVFNATTLVNVENLLLGAGHSYDFTLDDGNIGSTAFLFLNGASTNGFNLNAGAETDGYVLARGSGASDTFIGGHFSNTFYMFDGGDDTVTVFSGSNLIFFNNTLTAADRVAGDAGVGDNLKINLDGDYSAGVKLGRHTLTNVDTISVEAGNDYRITLNNGNTAAGATLTIDGSTLLDGDRLVLNGGAERDGNLTVLGGRASDTVKGGDGDDVIRGDDGGDTITPGDGNDIVRYGLGGSGESTGASYDTVVGFDFAAADKFDLLTTNVAAIDTKINSGTLRAAHVDSDLEAAVTGAELAANHAILFTPDAGNLSGHTFLIIDDNGTAGYQAGADYVIELVNAVHIGSLDTLDFT